MNADLLRARHIWRHAVQNARRLGQHGTFQAAGVFLACCAAATCAFWPRLQHGLIGAYDCAITFFPARYMAWRIVERFHELPLWSPVEMLGAPFFADGNTGALSPFNILFAFCTNSILAFNIIAIAHFGVSGLGAFLFLRAWRVRGGPALFGALAFALCGFMTHNKEPIGLLFSVVWMPWMMYGLECIAQRRWRLGAAVLASAMAMQVYDGIPQTAFYTHCFVAAYAVFRATLLARQRWLYLAVTAATWLAGLALSMPFLLCAQELLQLSVRATSTYDYTLFGSLRYGHLLALVFPYLGGCPFMESPFQPTVVSGAVVYGIISWIGVSALCALPFAFATPDGVRRRLAVFMCFSAATALLLALADAHHLHFNLFTYLPIYGLFRDPGRLMFIWAFAGAVLAALAIDEVTALRVTQTTRLIIRVGLALACGVVISVMGILAHPEKSRVVHAIFQSMRLPAHVSFDTFCAMVQLSRYEILLPLVAALASSVSLMAGTCQRLRHAAVLLLLAVLVAEQRLTLPYYAPQSLPYATSAKLDALVEEYEASGNTGRLATLRGTGESFGALNIPLPLLQKYAMIPCLAQYTSFPLMDWACLFDMGLDGRLNMSKVFQNLFFLSQAHIVFLIGYPADNHYYRATNIFGVSAAYNVYAKPRAFLTPEFISVQDTNTMFTWLVHASNVTSPPVAVVPALDNYARVYASAAADGAGISETCVVLRATANSLRIAAQCPAKRLLVVSDTYYPGWVADIDGKPAPIERVNGVMRGIFLDPGKHVVTLRYRPPGVRYGLYCAALGGVLLVMAVAAARHYARKPPAVRRWPAYLIRSVALILMLLWMSMTMMRHPYQALCDSVRGRQVVVETYFTPPHTLAPAHHDTYDTLLLPNVVLESNTTYQFEVLLAGTPGSNEYVLADLIAVMYQWNPPESRIVVMSDQLTNKPVAYASTFFCAAPPQVTDMRVTNLGDGTARVHAMRLTKPSGLSAVAGAFGRPDSATFWVTVVYLGLTVVTFLYCPYPQRNDDG